MLAIRGCPRNCDRRVFSLARHWIIRDPGRPEEAMTREPGDLPFAVVLCADGVCRADEELSSRDDAIGVARGGQP